VNDEARARWMSILARAEPRAIGAAWAALDPRPAYRMLRPPETGLVMVRGRAGGTGAPFNLGEMTVTRCSIQLSSGQVGHGYVAGRNPEHAEAAAVFDALLQDPERHPAIAARVVEPLAEAREARERELPRRAAATRVEFFTMVRGEE
jgi:alpha-D-ribose 1-methylphosphonate 5-triphosphate synthase subunit PhnG